MAEVLKRQRTMWDVILGSLLLLGAVSVLSNVVIATVVSVVFLGWTALVSGVVLLLSGLLSIRRPGAWSPILGGVLIGILGFHILSRPASAIVLLTLFAGSMFLATGLVRLVSSPTLPSSTLLAALSGLASVLLGILILTNIWTASFTLLGTVVGVQILIEGFTLVLAGRLRPVALEPASTDKPIASAEEQSTR